VDWLVGVASSDWLVGVASSDVRNYTAGVIHKKVGPALKHGAKGIKNNLKIEAQSSRLC